MKTYETMKMFSAELTVYRKGTTRVEFDLTRRLIIWSESTRWSRNFIRSLDHEEEHRLLRALSIYRPDEWDPYYPSKEKVEDTGVYTRLWHVSARWGSEEDFEVWGKDQVPPAYPYLIEELSEICRQHFEVID